MIDKNIVVLIKKKMVTYTKKENLTISQIIFVLPVRDIVSHFQTRFILALK